MFVMLVHSRFLSHFAPNLLEVVHASSKLKLRICKWNFNSSNTGSSMRLSQSARLLNGNIRQSSVMPAFLPFPLYQALSFNVADRYFWFKSNLARNIVEFQEGFYSQNFPKKHFSSTRIEDEDESKFLFVSKEGTRSHLDLAQTLWEQTICKHDKRDSAGSANDNFNDFVVVDCTCGNGHDSSYLYEILLQRYKRHKEFEQKSGKDKHLNSPRSHLHCIDIQESAIDKTRSVIEKIENSETLSANDIIDEKNSAPAGNSEDSFNSTILSDPLPISTTYHLQNFKKFPTVLPKGEVNLFVYNLGYLPGSGDKGLTSQTKDTLASIQLAVLDYLAFDGVISCTCYPGHEEGQKEMDAILSWAYNLDWKDYRVYSHRCENRDKAPVLITIQKLRPSKKRKKEKLN